MQNQNEGIAEQFAEHHSEISQDNVIHFMALDEDNPVSIKNSLHAARESARAVRGTITSEMWEALNHTWLQMNGKQMRNIEHDGISSFFEWVKERSHLSRGITYGTLLRDDAFRFLRLGTFLERADNTARILDVKYHILLPSLADVGGAADYYQWGALLRSVSAFDTYRRVYRDVITPRRVAATCSNSRSVSSFMSGRSGSIQSRSLNVTGAYRALRVRSHWPPKSSKKRPD